MEVSLIVPTYNESTNLEPLLSRIDMSLDGIPYEVIIVDDNSPDGTGALAESLTDKYPVRVIHRSGKLGLASAVVAGFAIARGLILGCM
ncbi:MAG: glycosyltransferase, partial [Candidatus Hydrogenedentes bacterium]|nr:glycosyltransferase [Candidatus Hydrogenedentota bacterium]